MDTVTRCKFCSKEITQNKRSGYIKIYCNQKCFIAGRRGLANRVFKYQLPLDTTKTVYPMPDNRAYNEQMNGITGLSRHYLDGEINLDTLRIMENEMNGYY